MVLKIRELRKARNMTQFDLAQAANISQSFVTLIETGQRRPSVSVAKRIASVLGFDWTEFFKEVA